jgi:hypothetical protein
MNTNKTKVSNHKMAAMVLAMLLAFTVAANAQSSQSTNGLGGTWRVSVQQQNCATGQPLGPSFQSLLSFHDGGTMSGTTSNPSFAPGQRTSDYGVWSFQGNQTYSAASEALILFNSAPPAPFLRGSQRIVQQISVYGDTFTSVATVQFFDSSHNLYIAGCAVATGTRFE